MSKTLQIGSDIFEYPEQGTNPGWGEEATAWAEAVTDALKTVQGPNDILLTSAALSNNITTFTDIPGFNFDTSDVQSITADAFIIRVYDSGTTTVTQSATITGNYDGSTFYIAVQSVGDAGMQFNITNAGQVQYKSSDLTNHTSTTIRFKAKTIDQP